MSKGIDSRVRSGYIGWCERRDESLVTIALLRSCGVTAWTKGKTCSLWTRPSDVLRAREIRRGIKAALALRGNAFDFLEGMRATLNARYPQRRIGNEKWIENGQIAKASREISRL